MITYNCGADGLFFLPQLQESSIPHVPLAPGHNFGRVPKLRHILCQSRPHAVLAFQGPAALYAELAGLPRRSWRLVVSERTGVPNSHKTWCGKLRFFHRLADSVVSNSDNNRDSIIRTVPTLAGRVQTIYNAVDLDYFTPSPRPSADDSPLRITVLASHQRNKNLINVLRALLLLRECPASRKVRVDWYGGMRQDLSPLEEARGFIAAHGLEPAIVLHEPLRDARQAYWSADAVMLASFYEGLPNTICEGMACAKPVLASNVCDNPRLVGHKENGFLFDPTSPASIAAAVRSFCELSNNQRAAMGNAGRRKAEALFDPDHCASRYLELLGGRKSAIT